MGSQLEENALLGLREDLAVAVSAAAGLRDRAMDQSQSVVDEPETDTDGELAPTDGDLLLVAAASAAEREIGELTRDAVLGARHSGREWSEIAAVLGVTKQAVQQRYGPPPEPVPVGGQRLLKPVDAFTELRWLERAGRCGWHSVGFGMLYHVLERSEQQWQHSRSVYFPGARRKLEAAGWQSIGSPFPWTYMKRALGTKPEPLDPELAAMLSSPGGHRRARG